MGKVVACIIARAVSTRLPLKVLRSLGGEYTMLDYMIKRLKTIRIIDEVFICTSYETVDEIMEDIGARNDVKVYRGSPENVIERMIAVGDLTDADLLIRITGDNPFTSVEYINDQVEFLRNRSLDYVRLIDVPIGATAEVMTRKALENCYAAMDPSVSEYLMLFMFEPKNFRCGVIRPFVSDYSNYSVTVDTPADLERTRAILEKYQMPPLGIKLAEIVAIMENNELPSATIKPAGKIKLPYGQETDFRDFQVDMQRRVSESELMTMYA